MYIETLKSINFAQTQSGDEGTASVARIMLSNTHVEEFDIEDNFVGDQASEALKEALIACRGLKQFSIADCMAGDDCASRVLEGLIGSPAPVQHLNLLGNKFGRQHVPLLIKLLEAKQHSLTLINLQENELDEKDLSKLQTFVSKTYNTQSFKMLTDPFEFKEQEAEPVELFRKFLVSEDVALIEADDNFIESALEKYLKVDEHFESYFELIDQVILL